MSKTRERSDKDEILTVPEVAKILRVNPYTVYDLLRTDRLHGFRIVRRWRIYKSSLDKFISRDN